jgi:hypothetical protein
MNRYRVELLGKVPYGLTHNEVFATVNSVLRDYAPVESVTKRRLAGNMVSIIAVFEATSTTSATSMAVYSGNAVTNWSFDTMVRKCVA